MNLKELFEQELADALEVVTIKERQVRWLEDRPAGCICDPRDWGDAPGDVCGKFVDDLDYPGLCEKCQHSEACHGGES